MIVTTTLLIYHNDIYVFVKYLSKFQLGKKKCSELTVDNVYYKYKFSSWMRIYSSTDRMQIYTRGGKCRRGLMLDESERVGRGAAQQRWKRAGSN